MSIINNVVEFLNSSQDYHDRWKAVDALSQLSPTKSSVEALFKIVQDNDDPLGPWALVAIKILFEDNPTIDHLYQYTFRDWKTSIPPKRLSSKQEDLLRSVIEEEVNMI